MKHYFRPQREQLRRALAEKIPALLTGGNPAQAERDGLTALLKSADEENWREVVAEAVKRLSV